MINGVQINRSVASDGRLMGSHSPEHCLLVSYTTLAS